MSTMSPAAYIAQDRRRAVAVGMDLPATDQGSALFADISGFTPLSEELARSLGRRRGAEALTNLLNLIYEQLIAQIERFGGSVVGFSGDAITCWFSARDLVDSPCDAPQRAVAAAAAMHETMGVHAGDYPLAIKVAIASGQACRCVVGNPSIQFIDVLGGALVDRVAAGEQAAQSGETLADETTLHCLNLPIALAASLEWREHAGFRFAPPPRNPSLPALQTLPPLPEVDSFGWIHPHVAPQLRAEHARFLAELRPATALFVRFAGINFDADEGASTRLDAYIRWVQQVIQRYEGLLVQLTTGDKGSYYYAAFGAPRAHDDDAVRAAAAALDLLHPPPELANFGPVQIGISSGAMRVGAYGGPTRCTYGVLGDEVNVAARLMSVAAPGQILTTAAAAEALRHSMALEPLGERAIKGKSAAVALYAIHGRSDQRAARMMNLYAEPLIGRSDEFDALVAALSELAMGAAPRPGRVLVIEGPAGIGKSHLAAAVVAQAASIGMRAIHVACQSTTQAIPFFAARQALSSLLGVQGATDAASVSSAVARLAPEAVDRAPLLADLLGISMADSQLTAGLDARVRQGARTALVLELIEAAAQRQTLLLTIEDAHWIDEASRDLFGMLATAIKEFPAALLLVQRPTEPVDTPLLPDDHALEVVRVSLAELTSSATAGLVAQCVGAPADALACAFIHAQSHGNPFFVEELVAALRDTGHLVATADGWRLSPQAIDKLRAACCLTGDYDAPHLADDATFETVDLGVPTSIQGIVLSRLDRLPDAARLTLKIASVIGRTFALDVLQSVRPLQGRAKDVKRAVDDALARDFVRADAATPAGSSDEAAVYLFRHNIIRDVAYNTLLESQQRELHLSVAEAIEARQPDDVEGLAHHYDSSDTAQPQVREQALYYLERAAARAQRDYANDTALHYHARAATLSPRALFLSGQVQALHILGRRDEEEALLERLDAAPDAAPAERARLWGEYFESIADYAQAESALRAGLGACAGDTLALAQCRNRLGMVAWRQGEYVEAESHFEAARALCGGASGESPEASESAAAGYGLGLVYRQQGRLDDARAAFEADLAWQRSHGSREREARARTALGHVESIAGRHEIALGAYSEALAIRKAIGDKAGIGASLLAVAQAYGSLGDHAQALPRLEEALRTQQSIRNRFEEWLVWNELGILHWLVGHNGESERCFMAGLAVSRAIGSDFGEGYLLCNLGQLQRDDGRPAEAVDSLRAALGLALAQGDSGLEATCRGDLALALLNLGDAPAALGEAAQAEVLLTGLGQDSSLTAVFAAQAMAHLAAADDAAAVLTARRGLDNLAAHGGDYFPHRDGYWCACVLKTCGVQAEANEGLRAAYFALVERAERISDPEMRSSFLYQIPVNRAILDAFASLPA